jgi:hypothetical protein
VQTGVIEKDEEIEEVAPPEPEDDGTGFGGRFNRAATWRKKPEPKADGGLFGGVEDDRPMPPQESAPVHSNFNTFSG